MTVEPECATCAWLRRVIRREVRLQEKRLRSGRAVDMTAIERAKADLAMCEAAGHHDPQAGPNGRWQAHQVATSP